MIKTLNILCVISAILLLSGQSFAQVKPPKKPDKLVEKTYEANYEELESYGIYRKPKEGSLGRDLWSKTPRSAILANLEAFPNQTKDPFLQKLIFGALLTRTNARLIENDIAIKPGQDLLTVRIKKLLSMGAYQQAADLYTLLEDEAYHPVLAFSGITALLASGNKSLACLEAKSAQQRFEGNKDIQATAYFCDLSSDGDIRKEAVKALKDSSYGILKSIARNKNYKKTYSKGALEKLSVFELGVLRADNRLKPGNLNKETIESMKPQHIMLLMNHKSLSQQSSFTLTQMAVHWGLENAEILKELYADLSLPENKKPEWAKLAFLYQDLEDAARGEESWKILKEALSIGFETSPIFLFPFAKQIENTKPKNPSITDIARAVSLLNTTDHEISDYWLKSLPETSEKQSDSTKFLVLDVISALYVAAPQYKRNKLFEKHLEPFDNTEKNIVQSNKKISLHIAIIDYFSGKNTKNNDAPNFYDKRLLLTSSLDYVMPTYQVWDRLHSAASKGSIGETILLNSNILRNLRYGGTASEEKQTMYPGMLRDVMESFDKVGLTQFSRQLAIDSALDL